jgi:hypothetical protein
MILSLYSSGTVNEYELGGVVMWEVYGGEL